MKFIHLSDTHVRKEYVDERIDAILKKLPCPAENVKKLFKKIEWKGIDFVVITGDLVHEGTEDDYQYLRQIIENVIPPEIKVLYVLGNHDHKKEFYGGINKVDKEAPFYYVEDVQGYRLIVLDSAVPGKESGTVSDEQLKWLEQVLETKAEKGTIVFLHHPIFWNLGGMAMQLTNGDAVLEVMKGKDVIGVFCGHTHTNAVQEKSGIRQYTADSMAFSIETNGEILAFTDKSGYAVTEVKDKEVFVHYETTQNDKAVVEYKVSEFAEMLKKMDE